MAPSRTRSARHLVVLLALVLAVTAVPGSPLRPGAADAGSPCTGANRHNQRLYIDADETTTEQASRVDSDGHVTHSYPKYVINGRNRIDIGRVTLAVRLCRVGGTWKVDTIRSKALHYDLDFLIGSDRETKKNVVRAVYVTDDRYGKGYRLVFRKVWKDLTVELQIDRCTPKPTTLTEQMQRYAQLVTSVPLPAPPVVGIAQFVGSALIPAATKRTSNCARMGDLIYIPMDLRSNGTLVMDRVMREAHTLWYDEDEAGYGCPGGEPYTEICRITTEERVTYSTTAN